ncbi:MAG: S24/S26 family peptidase [Thermoanaerobaculia bacterium]
MSPSRLFAELCADLLDHGCAVRFRAPGHSMHPTIENGEAITVEPVKPSQVVPGDILLYSGSSGPIAHRVLRVKRGREDVFLLAGDASTSRDGPVRPQQILGRVVSIERNCRSIDVNSRGARVGQALRLLASRLKSFARPSR